MKSTWHKKNPLLSMYLSGANAVAGAARGRANVEFRRQAALARTRTIRQLAGFWSVGLLAPTARKRRARSH